MFFSGFTPLSSSFLQLVNNRMFSDVEIIIDGVSFYAHKALLVARSTFFKSIFVDGNVPATVRNSYNLNNKECNMMIFYVAIM